MAVISSPVGGRLWWVVGRSCRSWQSCFRLWAVSGLMASALYSNLCWGGGVGLALVALLSVVGVVLLGRPMLAGAIFGFFARTVRAVRRSLSVHPVWREALRTSRNVRLIFCGGSFAIWIAAWR